MSIDLNALATPFPPEAIEWRVGSTTGDKKSGIALAYITARDVMERLDTVCGAANWQDRYEFHGSRTVCYLSVRIDSEWVTKADGAGDSDVEAEKGAISDALKRAAVKWGIGRYLYDLDSPWVELEAAGRSYKIKASEKQKLHALLTRNANSIAKTAEAPKQREPLKVITNEQPSGTYKTAAGYERQPGERLEPEDATMIGEVLLQAMELSTTVEMLNRWVKGQAAEIAKLPDAHYDTFTTSFLDYRTSLRAEGKVA